MGILVVLLLFISFLEGMMVQPAVLYDHTASTECISNPMKPLYGGGIIQNSEFNGDLTGWSVPWGVNATVGTSPSGNKFAAVLGRGARPSRSVSQKVQMLTNTHYSLSAWLQVSNGTVDVKATVKAPNGAFVAAGAIVVKAGCWTMLKGGMTAYSSGPAEIFFEADAAVDIMVDSVSLQPFSFAEWSAQRSAATDRARKSAVKVVARGADGKPLANATVTLDLSRAAFPFGNAMTSEILSNPAYERWFASRFTVATFENEMKWYSTERVPGREDYGVADAMLALARRHGIAVRGHNVLWDDERTQMAWVRRLNATELRAAAERRLRSVVARYAGKVIAWDVVNENLHWSFLESRLGPDASPRLYREVAALDAAATLFMNEYNTLEQPMDMSVLPTKYAARMEQIRSFPGNGGLKLAVGLESHFTAPNIPYMRASMDTLAALGIPLWLTEVDVAGGPMQAAYLEEVLREGYGHPSVQGIVMWAAWHARGCYVMCLTDNGFKNLPVGDVVDKLIAEWTAHTKAATTDQDGAAELDLVHGEYNFTVTHPSLKAPVVHAVMVDASSSAPEHVIDIKA
ncbi:hypothetical protein ACP70R_032882 [Stipagrostis hirtigluma subsp. patula]